MKKVISLREGYTTGSCAAAAAKAAAIALYHQRMVSVVDLVLPGGRMATIPIAGVRLERDRAYSWVIKDAGDDPDITHGAEIWVELQRSATGEIIIRGGAGVGIVTKPGLPIPPGQPAINPVPQRMIIQAVREVIGPESGAIVTISIPEGERLAHKTFNPRLGIIGGISIIGTTGIVRPMSDKGLKDALICSLDIARASGWGTIVLVPGNHGEQSVLKWFCFHQEQVVQTSNFIGFMLEQVASRGFTRIILAGHPGKLAKLLRGDFDTHSAKSLPATDIIICLLEEIGESPQAIAYCQKAVSVEDQIQYLKENCGWQSFDLLAQSLKTAIHTYLKNDTIESGVALFSLKKELIGITPNLKPQVKNNLS